MSKSRWYLGRDTNSRIAKPPTYKYNTPKRQEYPPVKWHKLTFNARLLSFTHGATVIIRIPDSNYSFFFPRKLLTIDGLKATILYHDNMEIVYTTADAPRDPDTGKGIFRKMFGMRLRYMFQHPSEHSEAKPK